MSTFPYDPPPVIRQTYPYFVGGPLDGETVPANSREDFLIPVATLPDGITTFRDDPPPTVRDYATYHYTRNTFACGGSSKVIEFFAYSKLTSGEQGKELWEGHLLPMIERLV